MKISMQAIAARPFQAAAAHARFVAGVGVAVTGAALWLADISRHLVA
jgi:hypothetical protein